MSFCPHCHGSGRHPSRAPQPYTTTRLPPKRMIPHGLAADAALREGTLKFAPYLFCGTCPHTGKDRWALAAAHIAVRGEGAALVLPEGEDPAGFRYPALPVAEFGVALVAWAYGLNPEQQHALGHALIAAGLDAVHVLGGSLAPLQFKAA